MTAAQFGAGFKNIWGVAAAVSASGPLAMWSGGLQPPWPANAGLTVTLFCAVAVILAFVAGGYLASVPAAKARRSRRKGHRLEWLAAGALLLGLIAALAYVYQYNRFVVTETQPTANGERQIRFVIGSEKRAAVFKPDRPDLELMREHLYQAEEIWTSESVQRARFSLFGSFALTFSLLTFGIGLLAARPRVE